MASRPFASVAVALEVGGDQEELLQVSINTQTRIHKEINKTEEDAHKHKREITGKKRKRVRKRKKSAVCSFAYAHTQTHKDINTTLAC